MSRGELTSLGRAGKMQSYPKAEVEKMTTDLIHDRGRGPEIVGTRITVYDLLPDFLDPRVTSVGSTI